MSNRIALRSFNPSTRLSGHSLWSEGWPVEATPGRGVGWRSLSNRTGAGRALCECGEMSPVLDSVNKRKRWHKEHKEQVRNKPAKEAAPITTAEAAAILGSIPVKLSDWDRPGHGRAGA